MVSAFEGNGWLTKVTGCNGQFCTRGVNFESAHAWLHAARNDQNIPPNLIDNDCGDRCSAFAYLDADVPVTPFGWSGFKSGIMLVYEASHSLWNLSQCSSTTDGFTTARVCCACGDPFNCPWSSIGHHEATYCSGDCDHDPTCQQLAAGCGVNLFDLAGQANGGDGHGYVGDHAQTSWGSRGCSESDVRSGRCGVCRQPDWCDDAANPLGAITTTQQWMNNFFDKDGGRALGSRQCRWRPSQKQLFIDTMRARFTGRARLGNSDHANVWNEVNYYLPADRSTLNQMLWDNLLGVVYITTAGLGSERQEVINLAAHYRALGKDVQAFEMAAETIHTCCDQLHWNPNQRVDIRGAPYSLREIT